jgi:hypothetical protein
MNINKVLNNEDINKTFSGKYWWILTATVRPIKSPKLNVTMINGEHH